MMKIDVASDYRVQELLTALNEGLVDVEFVRSKLTAWAGDQIDLVHYSDGEYDIVIH
jgi:hypothetical protein